MVQGTPADEQQRSPAVYAAIAIIATVVGAVLRAIEFSRDRPLWLDEAMLGLNIATRSFTELARPLDYDQSAPLLYLWLERLAVATAGVSEWSLRTVPFIAGVLLVPAVWIMARRVAGAATAAVATVPTAVSVTLLSFSVEGKQYGVDPLVTAGIVWLAARVVASPADGRTWRWLAIGGVLSLLLSQPAAFVLAGVYLAIGIDKGVRSHVATRRWMLLAGITWSSVFFTLYLTLYRETATSAYMQAFWEGTFLNPRAPDFLLRLRLFDLAAFAAPTLDGAALGVTGALAVAWLGGVWTLWRRSPFAAVVVAAPLACAGVASALAMYPVMDRLFLFAAPLTLIAYGSLAARALELIPERARVPGLVAVSAALALAVAPTHIRRVKQPVFYGVSKQVIADVDSMSRGDAVYVAARSFPLWLYYTTDWENPDVDRLRWGASIAGAGAPAHNNAPSRGRPVAGVEAVLLKRAYRGRTELVGLPTGRQYRTTTRSLSPSIQPADLAQPRRVDSGWAQVDVQRVAVAARPRAWVFGSHMFAMDGAEPGLVSELQRRGVRLLMERRQGATVAYHVEFPSEP